MIYDLNDDDGLSISKFENMLKSNEIGFFDGSEFEDIIEHYLEIGKMVLARKAISMSIAQHPTSVSLRLYRAELLIFENKFEQAHLLLNELHELEPQNSEIYVQKANIFSKSEDHQRAIESLEIAVELTADPADVYNLIGMEYLFIENYVKAKASFMKCLEYDHEDYSALYNIMYCFDFLEEQDKAILFLNIYLESHPYSEVAWHQLGKQYFDQKKYNQALEAFDFAIIADDSFIGAYLEKGKVLEKLKRYPEAITNYEFTLSLDDPTSFAYLRMGKCYLKLKKKDKAIFYFSKTVDEDPLLDKGWLAIVNFYCDSNEFQKALMFMEKAIEIDSENALYWCKFADINRSLGFYEEAEYGYKMALDLGNFELKTWIDRADLLIKLGEYQAAQSSIEQAMDHYPEQPELQMRMGGILLILNKINESIFFIKEAFCASKQLIADFKSQFPEGCENSEIALLINTRF